MNAEAGKRTVYHISPLRLWTVPLILIAIAIFMLTLAGSDTGTPDTRKLAIYMGIFFLAFAAVMYLILRRTRLVLSADGIRLYQFGYVLETEWDNVTYLYNTPGAEGLVLHNPMACWGARTLAANRSTQIRGVNFFSDEQIQLLAEYRLIPIEAFAYWLKRGLHDDLVRRAPALGIGSEEQNVPT